MPNNHDPRGATQHTHHSRRDQHGATKRIDVPQNKLLQQISQNNMLPRNHPDYIPPNGYQIKNLIQWSGYSATEITRALGIKDDPQASTLRYWSRPYYVNPAPGGKEASAYDESSKEIPSAIWQYMLVVLGLVPAPDIRRVEPSTSVEHSFVLNNTQYSLSARINFKRGVIKLFFSDSLPSDETEILSLECSFSFDEATGEQRINGNTRHDACPWELSENEGEKELILEINNFIAHKVWWAIWRLFDYHSLDPEMFLRASCLLHISDPDFTTPNRAELLQFKRWIGADIADLASMVWVKRSALNFWTSTHCEEQVQFVNDDKSLSPKAKANKLKNLHINPQAWHLLTSAVGLAPPVKVLGRKSPDPTLTRKWDIVKTHGVPIKWLSAEFSFVWNAGATELYINYAYNSESRRSDEQTVCIPIATHIEDEVHTIFGASDECAAPDQFVTLFTVPDFVTDEYKEFVTKYIRFVVWKKIWEHVRYKKYK